MAVQPFLKKYGIGSLSNQVADSEDSTEIYPHAKGHNNRSDYNTDSSANPG